MISASVTSIAFLLSFAHFDQICISVVSRRFIFVERFLAFRDLSHDELEEFVVDLFQSSQADVERWLEMAYPWIRLEQHNTGTLRGRREVVK